MNIKKDALQRPKTPEGNEVIFQEWILGNIKQAKGDAGGLKVGSSVPATVRRCSKEVPRTAVWSSRR